MDKKRKMLTILASATAALTVGVFCSQVASEKSDLIQATHKTYTLTLNVANKLVAGETSAFSRNTELGNAISFVGSGVNKRDDDWFCQLASGTNNYFYNSTAISGIEKITVVSRFKAANGQYKITAGASSSDLNVEKVHSSASTEGSNVTTVFEYGGTVNFFKIENVGTNCGTYISSLTVQYSCVAADSTRDTKEKASGDILYGALQDQAGDFHGNGYAVDMRSADVSNANSGYSAYFKEAAPLVKGYPLAVIDLANEIDLRGYGLSLDVKFVNCHNWFAFSALDADGNYIIRQQYGGIGIDTTKDLGNFVSATIPQADINDETKLEPGRTIADLAHVKAIVFTFNFEDNVPTESNAREVTLDNIQFLRGKRYADDGNRTLAYIDLGRQIPLTETIAFDLKFDNPTVHQEVGFNFYEASWGSYFGQYWVDKDSTHNGWAYLEENYQGVKVAKLADGYFRIYADLSKLNAGSSKPTSYVQYLFLQAPNTMSNRGSGWVDVLPVGRVYTTETYIENSEVTANVNNTVSFPRTFFRGDGIVTVDFTFTNDGKFSVMVGNWNQYNGYYDINKSSSGQVYTGVIATKLSSTVTRVTFDLSLTVKGDETVTDGYQFFFIQGKWTTANGSVSVFFDYH